MRHWMGLAGLVLVAGLAVVATSQAAGSSGSTEQSSDQAVENARQAEARRLATLPQVSPPPVEAVPDLSAADIKVPADLRKAAIAYELDKSPPAPTCAPPPQKRYLWIADFLGSKDAALRDAAADIVATSRKPFDAAVVMPYFDGQYPLHVRMAAAVWAGNAYRITAQEKEAYLKIQAKTYELLTLPVPPPYEGSS